jgi:hypothetical protein
LKGLADEKSFDPSNSITMDEQTKNQAAGLSGKLRRHAPLFPAASAQFVTLELAEYSEDRAARD